MPAYDYKCNTCGKEFEYQQKMSEEPLKKCPADVCTNEVKGYGEVHRIFSKNGGLVFKGSGFYLTDYTNKQKSKPTESAPSSCNSGACTPKASA